MNNLKIKWLIAWIPIQTSLVVCTAKPVKVVLIGDSTVTDASGWGKAFADCFTDEVTVVNLSVGGRSSKSWYDEGRLPAALQEKPDYVSIQFGHNGQPGKGPERETNPEGSYRDYLELYVREFRYIGAEPIILSSVTRRKFDENGKIVSTLTPWADGARAVAEALHVPFIDLHAISLTYNRIGPKASMTFNPEESDTTHFNQQGAEAIANLIAGELKVAVPSLASYLKD